MRNIGSRGCGSDGASPSYGVCQATKKRVRSFSFFLERRTPFLRIEGSGRSITLSRVSSWRSLSGLRVDKAASYRHMSFSTAHNVVYASVQEERARPIYQQVLHPRASTGARRSKVEGF